MDEGDDEHIPSNMELNDSNAQVNKNINKSTKILTPNKTSKLDKQHLNKTTGGNLLQNLRP
jgi:hypothetical protein